MDSASARHLTDHGSDAKRRVATFASDVPPSPSLGASHPGPSPVPGKESSPLVPATEGKSPALPSPPQPLSSGPRPNRRILLAAGSLAGLLAVGGGIWWQFFCGEPNRKDTNPKETETTRPEPWEQPAKEEPFTGVILNGGGSTFIHPLMARWAAVYKKARGVHIEYQAVGSGRGTEGVFNRVYLFGCSDAPLSNTQLARAKKAGNELIHVPLALGAVVPAYNLPGVSGRQLRFTGPILADIYLGKITHWNDPALKIANPGVKLPDLAITPAYRSDKSGTTFIWTDYLSRVDGEWKTRFGPTMQLKCPIGVPCKGSNPVSSEVRRTVGALGYVELCYALEMNLKYGQVKNREGKYVTPTLESVTAAAGALTDVPADLRLSLIDVAGESTYPIVGLTYALVPKNQTTNLSGRDLVAFLRWATHEGQAYAKELKYAPLPPELVQRIDTALADVKLAAK